MPYEKGLLSWWGIRNPSVVSVPRFPRRPLLLQRRGVRDHHLASNSVFTCKCHLDRPLPSDRCRSSRATGRQEICVRVYVQRGVWGVPQQDLLSVEKCTTCSAVGGCSTLSYHPSSAREGQLDCACNPSSSLVNQWLPSALRHAGDSERVAEVYIASYRPYSFEGQFTNRRRGMPWSLAEDGQRRRQNSPVLQGLTCAIGQLIRFSPARSERRGSNTCSSFIAQSRQGLAGCATTNRHDTEPTRGPFSPCLELPERG